MRVIYRSKLHRCSRINLLKTRHVPSGQHERIKCGHRNDAHGWDLLRTRWAVPKRIYVSTTFVRTLHGNCGLSLRSSRFACAPANLLQLAKNNITVASDFHEMEQLAKQGTSVQYILSVSSWASGTFTMPCLPPANIPVVPSPPPPVLEAPKGGC